MYDVVLQDVENNTAIEIVHHCYSECCKRRIRRGENSVPDYFEISDECLEFVTDNVIRTVTFLGMRLSSLEVIDSLLRDILLREGFIFRENDGNIINTHQIVMFDELYDEV